MTAFLHTLLIWLLIVVANAATPDLYSYAGGDPVNHVDPTGRSFVEIFQQQDVLMNGASLFRRDGNAGGFIDRVVNRTLNAWDSAYHNASLQAYSSNPWAVMGTMGMNALQTGLEVASYVPVLGAPASLANAYLHGIRGNYNAAKRELYAGGVLHVSE